MVARVARFVEGECARIDALHLRGDLPRTHAAWVLFVATLAVISPRIVGSPESFTGNAWLSGAFASLPWPESHAQLFWALWKGVQYGLLPWACVRFVLGRSLRAHGLAWGDSSRALGLVLAVLVVMLPITIVAARSPGFAAAYPKCPGVGESLARLVLWELAYAFQFVMVELFFRGFLIFSLARDMGWLAVFVMVVPYAMIHLQKPFAECAGSVFTGIFLGALALRTRSIASGAMLHVAVGVCMDLAALHAKGQLPL